tara:strand:+ start:107 stop:394 length:288 start_codon:yes stop_codon:yes gene_type:complete
MEMEDIFISITEKRVANVSKRWNITPKDAYELILNFESRQNIEVLPIVVNPIFTLQEENDIIARRKKRQHFSLKRNNTVRAKKKHFFSFLFKCCR